MTAADKPTPPSRTLDNGTTITVQPDRIVVMDAPAAPPDMRNHEVGRLIDDSFQPAPFSAFGLTPATLRALADLIEEDRA